MGTGGAGTTSLSTSISDLKRTVLVPLTVDQLHHRISNGYRLDQMAGPEYKLECIALFYMTGSFGAIVLTKGLYPYRNNVYLAIGSRLLPGA